MDEKQKKEYLNEFRDYLEKKASSRENAVQFMKDIGVYTQKGGLASSYRTESRSR